MYRGKIVKCKILVYVQVHLLFINYRFKHAPPHIQYTCIRYHFRDSSSFPPPFYNPRLKVDHG